MKEDRYEFGDLVDIMDRLRDPGGCPWDREQDYGTLRSYLLEECYEVVDALDRSDETELREELGDLLFQIVFLSRIAKERGRFEVGDVVQSIAEKMVRRHPHVFGSETAETSADVLRNWEEIKKTEKENDDRSPARSVLEGIPTALPALLKAQRLGTKAARVGFDWARNEDLFDKVDEELAELRDEVGGGRKPVIQEELGDLLFTLAMLARRLEIDPEAALEGANLKFRRRFQAVEDRLRAGGRSFEKSSLEDLDELWNEVKKEEA